eukprot:CAMPEP_0118843520 /NCGR_PEP_ID=MMETSP1162-20130426/82841_1 /TAXON_ID=33656 /ORGANISM="Phaeocystis Sp, Strain CCMP2710" /LENGTH=62 /DNA_ID=CAMNT_0006775615 /DNA_START=173 /DNA_END=361 /DNA_ORIENTATION=+
MELARELTSSRERAEGRLGLVRQCAVDSIVLRVGTETAESWLLVVLVDYHVGEPWLLVDTQP